MSVDLVLQFTTCSCHSVSTARCASLTNAVDEGHAALLAFEQPYMSVCDVLGSKEVRSK